MRAARRYLAPEVVVEPRVLGWYAWPQLLAPQTAALHIQRRHLPIMRSYVRAPDVHRIALQDSALRGGPFLDLDGQRATEVQILIEHTERLQAGALRLASAISELDELVMTAQGDSLEPLYQRIPEPLVGFVELAYDLHHRPRFRFLETLLYDSAHYDEANQQLVVAPLPERRPFTLSTPSLPDTRSIRLPFERAHLLTSARFQPVDVDELAERIGAPGEAFASLFIDEAPPEAPARPTGAELRVRYFGHACVLVQTAQASVLVDPLIPYGRSRARFGFHDLPKRLDCVVLTHAHADHASIETLLAIKTRVDTVIVPAGGGELHDISLAPLLRRLGFRDVRALSPFDSVEFAGSLSILSLPFMGEHSDLDVRSKHVPLIRAQGRTLLFASDIRCPDAAVYRHVRSHVGQVDALFLGLESLGAPLSWLYGPLLPEPVPRHIDNARRVNAANAAMARQLVDALGPSHVFAYALGLEPWLEHLTGGASTNANALTEAQRLHEECARRGSQFVLLDGSKDIRLERSRGRLAGVGS